MRDFVRGKMGSLQRVKAHHLPMRLVVLLVLIFVIQIAPHTTTAEEVTTEAGPPLIKVGIIFPTTVFKRRSYQNQIRHSISPFGGWIKDKYRLTYESFIQVQMERNPSNASIQDAFDNFLSENVSAIIYPTVHQLFGPYTESSQYFLQLAANYSIPVIAWNADNSGLQESSRNGLVIQMAPTIYHQAAAMLTFLAKYGWHDFTVVTTKMDGYNEFVESIKDQIQKYADPQYTSKPNINFTMLDHLLVNSSLECLSEVNRNRSSNIFLLYSTHKEALDIMRKAEAIQLTGKNNLWFVTESIIGDTTDEPTVVANRDFPVGMIGVHFESSFDGHLHAIMASIRVFAYGVMQALEEQEDHARSSEEEEDEEGIQQTKSQEHLGGHKLYKSIKNLALQYYQCYDNFRKMGQTKYLPLEFNSDGTRKDVELSIMNFRKSQKTLSNKWEEVGTWSSLLPGEVFIDGIVWPGWQSVPPVVAGNTPHKGITGGDESMADITGRIVLQQCLRASLNFPGETDQSEVLDLQMASDYIGAPMATDNPQSERLADPDTTKTIPVEFSSEIGKGVVVFISFLGNASEETVNKLVEHITNVRLTEDGTGKRLSIQDVQGDILIVPQATLGGNLEDGSMVYQRNVDKAFGRVLYDKLCQGVHEVIEGSTSGNVKCGVYGARQRLNMDTDGPFTHIITV